MPDFYALRVETLCCPQMIKQRGLLINEHVRLEVPDARLVEPLIPLLLPERRSDAGGESIDGAPGVDQYELTLRLAVREQGPMYGGGPPQERWHGRPPRFQVRYGEMLEAKVDMAGRVIEGWVHLSLMDSNPDTALRIFAEAPLAAPRAELSSTTMRLCWSATGQVCEFGTMLSSSSAVRTRV